MNESERSTQNAERQMLVVILIVVAVFAWEMGRFWWNQNAWRRQWRNRHTDDD